MSANVIVNPIAPENLRVVISRGNESVDLSTVTAVSLEVYRKGSSIKETWNTIIVQQSVDSITVSHIFNQGDADIVGVYIVLAFLTIPSGTIRARCGSLNVINP